MHFSNHKQFGIRVYLVCAFVISKTNFKMKLRSLSALLLILDKNNLGNLELQNRILRNIHIGKRADMYLHQIQPFAILYNDCTSAAEN